MIQEVLTQTDSSTATILQQISGVSFLGASLTDWITAITAVVVAIFAYVTVREARKNRRKNSIEKQLEKLYNPFFEIMDQAYINSPLPEEIIRIDYESYAKLWNTLLSYGHFLDTIEHDQIRDLLLSPKETGHVRGYDAKEFEECIEFIREKREDLRFELRKLT